MCDLLRYKHGDDPSEVERHVYDCLHADQELPFGMRWVQAMRSYVDKMVDQCPGQLGVTRKKAGVEVMAQFSSEQEAIQQSAVAPGEEYNFRTLPYYTYTEETNQFLRFLEIRCENVSASGAVCRGILARFHGQDESLYPSSSVMVCRKCRMGYCGHELVRPGLVLMGTRNLAALARHTRRADPPCCSERVEGLNARGRLMRTLALHVNTKARDWVERGRVAVHPVDLTRLMQVLGWHVDRANLEADYAPMEEEEGESGDAAASGLGSGDEDPIAEARGLEAHDIQQGVMVALRTMCPECSTAAEAGEGCDLSLVACANPACPVSSWCVRCDKAKKLARGQAGERVSKRCVCSSVLEGETCYNWRWEHVWEPQLRGIADRVSPAGRGQAMDLLHDLVRDRLDKGTPPENNEQWERRFYNQAFLLQHEHLQGLRAKQIEEASEFQRRVRMEDDSWAALKSTTVELGWRVVDEHKEGMSTSELVEQISQRFGKPITIVRGQGLMEGLRDWSKTTGCKVTVLAEVGQTRRDTAISSFGEGVSGRSLRLIRWRSRLWYAVLSAAKDNNDQGLPSLMDGQDASRRGYKTFVGSVALGSATQSNMGLVQSMWNQFCRRSKVTNLNRRDYVLVPNSTMIPSRDAFGLLRMDTLSLFSTRSADDRACCRSIQGDAPTAYETAVLAAGGYLPRLQQQLTRRLLNTMIHLEPMGGKPSGGSHCGYPRK